MRQALRFLLGARLMPQVAVVGCCLMAGSAPVLFAAGGLPVSRDVAGVTAAMPFGSKEGMSALSEDELGEVYGQALFAGDKISPDSLTGHASQPGTDFTFYRMGLDVEMRLNMNIAKLQLGCGGINDALTTDPQCDIDLDYVRMMGRSGTAAGDPVTSDFVLKRPYVEIAVRDDHNPAAREVVGFKIGGQEVDGFMGIGRRYTSNGPNLENMGPANCNTSAEQGSGVVGCHSGVNALSGFLGAELSVWFPVTVIGLLNGVTCSGYIDPSSRPSGLPSACTSTANRVFLDVSGTRMKSLDARNLTVHAEGSIVDWFSPLNARVVADLRLLHGFAAVNTEDFFMSFQREVVSWPRFSKTTPPNNLVDNCNPGQGGSQPARCSSAYAVPANTGWWLNIPDAKLTNIAGSRLSLGLGDAFDTQIINPELNSAVPINCYGGRLFC